MVRRQSSHLVALCVVAGVLTGTARAERPLAPQSKRISTGEHKLANAQSVAFSPDGRLVAAAFGGASNGRFPLKPTEGGIAVWNAETGKRVQFVGEYGDIVSLNFTSDSKSLLYGRLYTPGDSVDDDTMALVDIATGEKSQPWGRFGRWHVCAASPTQDVLLMEHGAAIAHVMSQAELRAGKQEGIELAFADSYSPRCAAFSPQGKCFAVVHGRTKPIPDADGKVRPNAKRIVYDSLTLFDTDMQGVRCRVTNDALADCYAVSLAPDGKWIATGHRRGVVRIWDGKKNEPARTLTVPSDGDARPIFSPDGQTLAVLAQASSSRTWRYADTPSGFAFDEADSGVQSEVVFFETKSFLPTGRWQFEDGAFRTWHANRPQASLNPGRIAYSPDGKRLLIGAAGVTLIDVATGEYVRTFDVD